MDKDFSQRLFKRALNNDSDAMYELAMHLKQEEQYEKCISWLQKSADLRHAAAQYELANCYYAGVGVQEQIERAFYYYEQAAMQGHADAANNLADMYLNGEATVVDEQQALKWFQVAAEQHVMEALFTLGLMYEQGLGTVSDAKRAYTAYSESAALGYEEAQYRLGMIHLEGLLEQSIDELVAIQWFERAAAQFHVDAIYNLGYIYEGKRNGQQAAYYYKQAALLDDEQAKYQLASMYRAGIIVPKNEEEARKWEQAAQQ